MRRWFWQRLWQPFHDFGAIGENRDLSVSGISIELEGLQRSRPHFKLGSVARRKIVTRRHPSSAATATRDGDFKVARCLLIRASDMSGIDAGDEFAQGIIGHSELKLCALACQRRTFPLLPKRLIFQAGAKRQGSLAHRLMAFRRFNGPEFRQNAGFAKFVGSLDRHRPFHRRLLQVGDFHETVLVKVSYSPSPQTFCRFPSELNGARNLECSSSPHELLQSLSFR